MEKGSLSNFKCTHNHLILYPQLKTRTYLKMESKFIEKYGVSVPVRKALECTYVTLMTSSISREVVSNWVWGP